MKQGSPLDWMRAFPTMLRVGLAETIAYRFEFLIWVLTNTLPLVMLGLWTSVASEGPFAQYQEKDFIAYYLATLIVRNLTGSWVVWQINEEVRQGALSMRLLRPVHPFVAYMATHLSAIPVRAVIAIPMAVVMLVTSAREVVTTDPFALAMVPLAFVGAWILTFFALIALGLLSLFIERSVSLFSIYLGVFSVFSGYLLPLDLLPSWLSGIAAWSPFRFMLSFPVEIIVGAHRDHQTILGLLGLQWLYALGAVVMCALVWRAGIHRYEAYGS